MAALHLRFCSPWPRPSPRASRRVRDRADPGPTCRDTTPLTPTPTLSALFSQLHAACRRRHNRLLLPQSTAQRAVSVLSGLRCRGQQHPPSKRRQRSGAAVRDAQRSPRPAQRAQVLCCCCCLTVDIRWGISCRVLSLWQSNGLSFVPESALWPSHRDLPPPDQSRWRCHSYCTGRSIRLILFCFSYKIVCRIESCSIKEEGSAGQSHVAPLCFQRFILPCLNA